MSKTPQLGGKITTSHGTTTEASAAVVDFAARLDDVTKISLGEIRHVPGGRRDIKFLPINGGIKAVVRGGGAVQHLYIYTKNPDAAERRIGDNFRG